MSGRLKRFLDKSRGSILYEGGEGGRTGKEKKNVHDEGCGPSSFATERGSQTVRGSMARGTIFQPNFHSDYFPKSKILFHARHTLSLFLSPLNFLLRLVRKEKRAAKREREDKEEEEEEGRIEKVLVSEATQRD